MKKNVAILVFRDVEVLDFAGPFEVFSVTDGLGQHQIFRTFIVAESAEVVEARNGFKVVPDFTLANCPRPDILIVPGGQGTRALLRQPALLKWVNEKALTAEIVMSVCTGALVLAKAGLLDGLRITTHHGALDELAAVAPTSIIDSTARFHDNGKFVISAGISAGIDCSLHVIGRLLGPEAAAATARQMEYESGPAPAGKVAAGPAASHSKK